MHYLFDGSDMFHKNTLLLPKCFKRSGYFILHLLLTAVFIVGWLSFFSIICVFFGETVNGHFNELPHYHNNFYFKAILRLSYAFALIWIFIDLAADFFQQPAILTKKIAVLGYSILAAAFVLAAELSVIFWQEQLAPLSYHPYAFWHPAIVSQNTDSHDIARTQYHHCGYLPYLTEDERGSR